MTEPSFVSILRRTADRRIRERDGVTPTNHPGPFHEPAHADAGKPAGRRGERGDGEQGRAPRNVFIAAYVLIRVLPLSDAPLPADAARDLGPPPFGAALPAYSCQPRTEGPAADP